MSRPHITLSMKVQAFTQRALCPVCKQPYAGNVEFDHIRPLSEDGPHTGENLEPIHTECHKPRTSTAATRRAKTRKATAAELEHRRKMLAKDTGGEIETKPRSNWPKGRKIRSRKFSK